MIEDVNDWETAPKIATEKEKKEVARKRIESEVFNGNPNIPKVRTRKLRFKPPTKEQAERMKLLDHLGNPIKGYKWGKYNKQTKLMSIVPIPDYEYKTSSKSFEDIGTVYIKKYKD